MSHLLKIAGTRKKSATEPPFIGLITDEDGTPTDLSTVLSIFLRIGTPGQTPVIDAEVTITDAPGGEWQFSPSAAQANALPVGDVLMHVIINWTAELIEAVPNDTYFKLHVLEML